MRESRFVWVSANVWDRATGRPFGGAPATHVVERGGVAVGFFGPHRGRHRRRRRARAPGSSSVDPIAAAREAVAELRAGRRPIVVAVTHQDMPADERMAREVPGIQLVIGGHEHDPLENVVGETLITKAGSDGVFVVRIDLQVTRDGKVLARQHRFIPITPDLPEDPAMAALVARYQGQLERGARRADRRDAGAARRAQQRRSGRARPTPATS